MSAMVLSEASSSPTRIDQPSVRSTSPLVEPIPTVYRRTPRSAASLAAPTGSGPVLACPSDISTITADSNEPAGTGSVFSGDFRAASRRSSLEPLPAGAAGRWPTDFRSMPAPGKSVARLTTMALPIAVPRWGCSRSRAWLRSSRLPVGAWTSDAVPAKLTMPIRVLEGWASMKARAAAWAAASRVGCRSVARMLPEMSSARMTVRWLVGMLTTVAGRESANSISARPSRNSSGGR